MKCKRLDQLVVERGLAESREKAQRLIRAGVVRVDGHVQTKPGNTVSEEKEITVEAQEKFVGRGGLKLEEAFQHFQLSVRDAVCLDAGASTGGFTDCLLQHGAAKVYAIDVGQGQLHWRLQSDPRVVVMDQINVRHLKSQQIPEKPTFATIDVSFISLSKVLPAVVSVLANSAKLVTLIKPQFEAGREHIEKGGVVRDAQVHQDVIEKIKQFGEQELGLRWKGCCPSPIQGPAGNIEFLALWEKTSNTSA